MFGIILTAILASASRLEAVEIACEKIDHYQRFDKCCHFNEVTVIDAANVTIAGLENSEVQAMAFSDNKNIKFLPVSVYTKFPTLEFYLAQNAAIKEISALNFEKLSNLKVLDLSIKEIEFISDDCFQGLRKLFNLDLRNES